METDELHVSRDVLAAHLSDATMPYMTQVRISESTPESFLNALTMLVRAHVSLQVLYVSAHGNAHGLCYKQDGTSTIGYATFGRTLSGSLRKSARISLVMGSCEALSPVARLEAHLPRAVAWLFGFTERPIGKDVAELVAEVLLRDAELFESIEAHMAEVGDDDSIPDAEKVAAAQDAIAGAVDDATPPVLGKLVSGTSGGAIRVLHQTRPGVWTGRTVPLR